MFYIKTFAMFALVCVGSIAATNKTRFNLNEKFDDSVVKGDLHDSLVSYIACDQSSGESKTAKKCRVIHGTVNGNREKKSCDLEFKETMQSTNFHIHAISADKTLVVWGDADTAIPHNSSAESVVPRNRYSLKFTIVHLPNCQTFETEIDFDNLESLANSSTLYENAFIPNHDGTFDVFFENTKYCSSKVCRLTLDTHAKIVRGPTPSYEPVKSLYDAATELNPIDNNFVVYEARPEDTVRISLVTSNGRVILKETGVDGTRNYDVSTLDDKIRICSKSGDVEINCELFNNRGESISNTTVQIGLAFDSITLFNLPNGEFVLETEDADNSHVTKVGANGRRIGIVKLSHYICEGKEEITGKDVYAGKNEVCMARMCYSDTHVDVVQKCYDNSDFSYAINFK